MTLGLTVSTARKPDFNMGRKLMHQLVGTLCSSAREADDHGLADVGILSSPRYSLVLKLELKCLPNLAGIRDIRANCDTERKVGLGHVKAVLSLYKNKVPMVITRLLKRPLP